MHLPAPGPCRPGRRAQVRAHRRPQRARARERARDRGARRRRRRSRRRFCASSGMTVHSHVLQIGSVTAPERGRAAAGGLRRRRRVAGSLPRRPPRATRWWPRSTGARKANESLGGVFEVRAFGVLPGLGSYIAWDERLDARLALALMSIHAMKGVAIGDGFDLAGRVGSAGARRDLLGRRARVRPRDEPRRRDRGRHDDRRPGGRAGGDEAAADAHQAAALGRHRDEGAGPGAARAHRLLHGARGRRGGGGDGGAGACARLPREVRRRRAWTT